MVDKMLYSPEEAFELLSIGRAKGFQLLAAGDLPSIKVGRLRRIPADALHAWVREQLAAQSGEQGTSPEGLPQ